MLVLVVSVYDRDGRGARQHTLHYPPAPPDGTTRVQRGDGRAEELMMFDSGQLAAANQKRRRASSAAQDLAPTTAPRSHQHS
jgi:hypothetical protein